MDRTSLKAALYLPASPLHVNLGSFTWEGRQGRWLVIDPVLNTGISHYTLGGGSRPTWWYHSKYRTWGAFHLSIIQQEKSHFAACCAWTDDLDKSLRQLPDLRSTRESPGLLSPRDWYLHWSGSPTAVPGIWFFFSRNHNIRTKTSHYLRCSNNTRLYNKLREE